MLFDYRIVQWLLPTVGKKTLENLIYQHCDVSSDALTPTEKVYYLAEIHREGKLLGEIRDLGMENIFALETALIDILARMEHRGVYFDQKKMQDIRTRIGADIGALESEIYTIIGSHININSPKQLQGYFFDTLGLKPVKKNKTGYSVDNDVLEEIGKTHEVARRILEYRSLTKLASTYVEALLKAVDSRDGRIHTTYDSLGAATGRMSSNDPNLQNIPAGTGYAEEIKSCFIPSEDHIFLVTDYSQIELRILAFLSQDPALIAAFENKEDIHTRTARFLFWEEKTITSHERRIAKTVNFGVIYGITGFWLAKTLGVAPWEAQKYVDAFYEKYPGVRRYYDDILQKTRELGYTETLFGRRRYIAGINDSNRTMRQIAEREAMNMPVQWTAADIIKYAMLDIDAMIRNKWLQGKMILQIHDELVFDIPLEEKEIWQTEVKNCMEWVLAKYCKNNTLPHFVPIIAEAGFGNNWSEAK